MNKSSVAIVTILALGLGFGVAWMVRQSQPIQLEAGTWFGEQARALPDFELIDQNGETFTGDDLLGKWQLLFFGYTHCPDICPNSLQTLADTIKAFDDRDISDALQVIFVTVDPERDSPEILKSYVEYFNPSFIGATGSTENLDQLTRSIGISYLRNQQGADETNYEVAHSTAFVLLNPSVEFAAVFSAPHDSRLLASDLTKIIQRY